MPLGAATPGVKRVDAEDKKSERPAYRCRRFLFAVAGTALRVFAGYASQQTRHPERYSSSDSSAFQTSPLFLFLSDAGANEPP